MSARSIRWRLGASLSLLTMVLGTTVAVATSVSESAASQARGSVPACTGGQIVNWLNTAPDGYAGGVEYQLQFTNVSSKECSLSGFATVTGVKLSGTRIGVPAVKNGSAAGVVDLKPGATAQAGFEIEDTGNWSKSTCKPVTADGVRVVAAGVMTSDIIPFPFSICSTTTASSMFIDPTRAE